MADPRRLRTPRDTCSAFDGGAECSRTILFRVVSLLFDNLKVSCLGPSLQRKTQMQRQVIRTEEHSVVLRDDELRLSSRIHVEVKDTSDTGDRRPTNDTPSDEKSLSAWKIKWPTFDFSLRILSVVIGLCRLIYAIFWRDSSI